MSTEHNTAGIENRYHVEKVNDPTGKHTDCRYFVLDPKHDAHAVTALRAYADAVGGSLAADIAEWLRGLDYCPNCTQVKGHRWPCPRVNARWLAEAWDEGYDTGYDDCTFNERGLSTDSDAHEYPHANPHRLTADRATETSNETSQEAK